MDTTAASVTATPVPVLHGTRGLGLQKLVEEIQREIVDRENQCMIQSYRATFLRVLGIQLVLSREGFSNKFLAEVPGGHSWRQAYQLLLCVVQKLEHHKCTKQERSEVLRRVINWMAGEFE